MRLTRHNLNSRLARRMVVLFVLAALLPMMILAGLTFYQVTKELKERGGDQARMTAKLIGMDVFERLKYTTEELNLLARNLRAGSDLFSTTDTTKFKTGAISKRIDGLFKLNPDGGLIQLFGHHEHTGPEFIQRIHSERIPGKTMLLVTPSDSGESKYDIFLLVPLDRGSPLGTLLGAHLNEDILWDRHQLRSRPELICVLSEQNAPLYCNRETPKNWLGSIAKQKTSGNNSRFLWESTTQESHLSAFWSLFLNPHYQVREWTVAIGIPESEAMAPVSSFQGMFIRVMLLTLVFVALLSIKTVRNSLHPLGRLLQATRQLAKGEFTTRVRLETEDEFQELGDSFDQMASRLGLHFGQQQALAHASHRLQQSRSPEEALQVAMEGLQVLVKVERIGATCCSDGATPLQLWVWPLQHSSSFNRARGIELPDRRGLPSSLWRGSASDMETQFPTLAALNAEPASHITLVPAVHNDRTLAMLAFSNSSAPDTSGEQLPLLDQLGELLSITLANIFLQQRFRHQAHHDPLTSLPNRLFLRQQTEEAMIQTSKNGEMMALMIIDIDRFKMVNDTMGHVAGDELLIQASERLKSRLHPQDILSRFAGDEFVLVIPNLQEEASHDILEGLIARFDQAFAKPFVLGNRKIKISASKGVTFFPGDGDNFLTLLKNADAAMYQAKAKKSGASAFYSSAIQVSLEERVETEQSLIQAVAEEEFVLYYQPALYLDGEKVVGAEALVRWQHPTKGLVMPGQFIEIAEETGLIEAIGMWTLKRACMDFKQWQSADIDLDYVAVNVSGLQLQNPQFILSVKEVLLTTGMDPRRLELEVTETALIEEFESSLEKLEELRRLGIRIAVDDFGTGYASLKYLKALPADKLKIDRLFVKDLPQSKRDKAIISSVVTLSRELGFSLLAEGIETADQAEFLLHAGVPTAQGFLYSKPLPLPEFLAFVNSNGETGRDWNRRSAAALP